ncbi:OmpA family protein [Aurantimonas marina]|uniref:OmpA family protein n=1 Tax=Aurantimonas marina TaxID=2780508 RepID=UPI001E4D786C|nr:OmpA family protein [Aurantimonas marina]
MPNFKNTGRLVGVAALAASTAMSGPLAAYAQDAAAYRVAQAETTPVDPTACDPAAVAPDPAACEPAPAAEAPAEPAPAEPAPVDPAPAAEAPAEPAPAEAAPVETAPAEPAPAPAEPAPAAETPAEPVPVEPTPAEATTADPAPAPVEPAPAAEAPAEPAPAEAAPVETAPAEPAPAPAEPAPAAETPAEPGPAEAAPVGPTPTEGAPAEAIPTEPTPAAESPAEPAPAEAVPAEPAAAPVAEQAPAAAEPTPAPAAAPVEDPEPVSADIQEAPVPTGEISASDARVQQLSEPVTVPSITAEQGERIDAPADTASQTTVNDNSTTNNSTSTTTNNTTVNNTTVVQETRTELPPGAEVVERVGDRDILSIVGAGVAGAVVGGAAAYFIRGNDDDRIAVDAEERYYERLSGDRTRQTVVRPNGIQVVTITNRYGDVIQRSRILPDGREVVLFYDPYQDAAERPDYYYDPAADLAPVVLTIPEDQYIVDVAEPDEELYYRTIVAPPVETVERIYSIDEVRRSERIRDKVRRIDLNTINFAFGSAAIEQSEVDDLQALADAIARVIKENPAETFLVEGHTDAVGSEIANLALSDRRAEAVASALSQYFDVPPENLITQGYGEQNLKVKTQSANAENRRVTLRRITALVKPVATSAKR